MEMKKHILVTGGAGYIGSVLVGHLLGKGYQVTVVDCLLNGGGNAVLSNSYNESFTHWSLTVDEVYSRGVLPHFDFHAVVHLAALLRPKPGLEQEFKRINSKTTKSIFEAAAEAKIERFIFASTYFNYGKQPSNIIATERDKSNPWDAYTESKVEDEQYIFGMMGKPGYTIAPIALRFAQAYGLSPNMRWDLLINRFVRDAMVDKIITVFEKDVIRAFVHVHDIVRAIEYVIRDDPWISGGAPWGDILNVGGEHYTKDQIAKLIQQKCRKPVEIEYSDHKTTNSMPSTWIAFSKIQDRLNWRLIRSVEHSITAMMKDGSELGLF